ncbi:hypothetical protein NKG05_04540 [Oerskovia sp. M15]
MAALQALALSLAVVVLPAVAAFLASSAGPAGDSTGWGRACRSPQACGCSPTGSRLPPRVPR